MMGRSRVCGCPPACLPACLAMSLLTCPVLHARPTCLSACSAAMAVLRQQLTFVHELYESGEGVAFLPRVAFLHGAPLMPRGALWASITPPSPFFACLPACPPVRPPASLPACLQAWLTLARRMACWRHWTSACATWRSRVCAGAPALACISVWRHRSFQLPPTKLPASHPCLAKKPRSFCPALPLHSPCRPCLEAAAAAHRAARAALHAGGARRHVQADPGGRQHQGWVGSCVDCLRRVQVPGGAGCRAMWAAWAESA